MKDAFRLIDKLETNKELARDEWIFLFDNYDDESSGYLFQNPLLSQRVYLAIKFIQEDLLNSQTTVKMTVFTAASEIAPAMFIDTD